MEDENQENIPEEEEISAPESAPEEGYTPRPAWQVWAARIGLAAFLIFLIFYYLHIFGGR